MKTLRIAIVFLLTAGCLLLQSCQQGEILQVKGRNFDKLAAEEYTEEQMLLRAFYNTEYVYKGPLYSVCKDDGELWLNPGLSNSVSNLSIYTGYRQLFADSLGEWGGWVATANFFSELSQGVFNPETVITGQQVIGLYQKGMGDPVAYILSGVYKPHTVYRFTDLKEEGWKLEIVAELDILPQAALLDNDKLVIAASGELITVDVNTGETTVLYDNVIWSIARPNSIVKLGDSYFTGCAVGIFEYRISEGKMLFYPYPDYVPEEE